MQHEIAQGIALTHLTAREVHRLPKSVATSIFTDIRSLLDCGKTGFQSIIRERLQILGFDYYHDPVLTEALESDSLFDEAFLVTSSNSMCSRFCKDHLNYFEPVPIYVGRPNGSQQLVGHYIPVLKYMQHYLGHSDVWASCQKVINISEDLFCNYTDGLTWKQSGLPASHIRLHLYSDEFEVCNPLRSIKTAPAKVHKLCAFYFTVGNINVRYHS
jgi:hypothetical protein